MVESLQGKTPFSSMSQGVFFLNSEGHPEDVNPAALAMLGVERAEFLKRGPLSDAWQVVREDGSPLPPDEFPFLLALRTSLPVKNALTGIFNPLRNCYVWVMINAIPMVPESQDDPRRTLVTLHDVSDRKRLDDIHATRRHLLQYAEDHTFKELLTETLDRTEELTESTIGFYHFFDEESRQYQLQGWSTKTMMAFCEAPFQEGPHPLVKAGIWADAIHQRQPVIHNDYATLPHRKGLPEGHPSLVRELLVPVERKGRIVAVLGVGNKPQDYTEADIETATLLADMAWDVAQLKLAEEASERETHAWQATFDAMKEVIFLLDADMRIEKANVAATAFLGQSLAELQGRHCWEVVHGSIEPIQDCPVVISMQTQKREVRELQLDDRWMEITADPIIDAEGCCSGTVHIIEDITVRKEAQKHLVSHSSEMEHFIYKISHDLKSPMITIKGFLGLAQEQLQGAAGGNLDTRSVLDNLDYVDSAANRMNSLLEDLLKIARLNIPTEESAPVRYDDLLEEVLKVLAGRLNESKVEVQFTRDPLLLYGDRNRLMDIWQNLIENAIKYMGSQCHPRIEIGLERSKNEVVFAVRDNGTGIEPVFQHEIFDLFKKLDQTSEGTGLGLALVRRSVEFYRGRIWVESDGIGTGSCFFFTLPSLLTPTDAVSSS